MLTTCGLKLMETGSHLLKPTGLRNSCREIRLLKQSAKRNADNGLDRMEKEAGRNAKLHLLCITEK